VRTNGDYVLGATAGQAEAATLSQGDYTLTGGFWANPALEPDPTLVDPEYQLYLPLILH